MDMSIWYWAVIACGVLYHMRNPVELLHNIARITDRVYVWTQYYIKERLDKIPHMAHRWGESREAEHEGFRHTLHRYNYGDFLNTARFAGGSDEYSHWLSRDDLLGALRHAGLTDMLRGRPAARRRHPGTGEGRDDQPRSCVDPGPARPGARATHLGRAIP